MRAHEFVGTEMSLAFEGPMAPYVVGYSAEFVDESNLKIVYSVSPGILGGANEALILTITDLSAFTSNKSISLITESQFIFTFELVQASESAEAASSSASYMLVATFGVSVISSVLTGGSMELMWSLANTLQIVFMLGLLNLYYPANLLVAFRYMGYSNFENPVTKLLSNVVLGMFSFVPNPVGTSFDSMGFGSTNVITNSLDKLFMLFGFIFVVFVFYMLYL